MVTPEGGYVVAQPDSCVSFCSNVCFALIILRFCSVAWQKQVARVKGLSEADVRDRTPSDPSLICPIDNKLFKEPKKTPCCGTLYCEECIESHLLERDFICPNCGRKISSLDRLVIDKPMRTKVLDYIDREIEKSRQQDIPTPDESKPVADTNPSVVPNGTDDDVRIQTALLSTVLIRFVHRLRTQQTLKP